MTRATATPPRSATIGSAAGLLAIVAIVLGAGCATLRITAPFTGFLIMALAIPLSLTGLIASAIGLVATRKTLAPAGRGTALRGLLLSALAVILLLVPASGASGLPRINDITTDVDNPPEFVHAATLPENAGRDLAYPGESFARQQMKAYPDLGYLTVPEPPAKAFERVRDALASMTGAEITDEDPAAGRIEATFTSRLFHFVDDLVVRIVAADAGSKIDVRSKSRVGKGDMGANAERIRTLFAELH